MSCSATGAKDWWWSSYYSPFKYNTGRDVMDLNVESFQKATGVCCAIEYSDVIGYSKSDLNSIDRSQRNLLPPMLTLPKEWIDTFPIEFVVFLNCSLDTKGYYFGFNLLEIMKQKIAVKNDVTKVLVNPITQKPFTLTNLILFKKKFKHAYETAWIKTFDYTKTFLEQPKIIFGIAGPIIKFMIPFESYSRMFDIILSAQSILINNARRLEKDNLNESDYKQLLGDFLTDFLMRIIPIGDFGFIYKQIIKKVSSATSKAVIMKIIEKVYPHKRISFNKELYKELLEEEKQRSKIVPFHVNLMMSKQSAMNHIKKYCSYNSSNIYCKLKESKSN